MGNDGYVGGRVGRILLDSSGNSCVRGKAPSAPLPRDLLSQKGHLIRHYPLARLIANLAIIDGRS